MEVTEQQVFATIGRLTVENAALTQENARLKADLHGFKVKYEPVQVGSVNGGDGEWIRDSIGDEAAARES